MTTNHLAIILGTRPEIIKFSPIIRKCEQIGITYDVIHTGQHYSDYLDEIFFQQLKLPTADYNLGVGSGSHGQQTGRMIENIEELLLSEKPDVVLVQGDTNTALAGAIATDKLDAQLGHIEAGLRSFDRSMPEETNRRVIDHLSEYLFAPTADSVQHLQKEDIPVNRIFQTGNTIVDALSQNISLAKETSTIVSDLGLDNEEFGVLTAHRAENVDNGAQFSDILEGVRKASNRTGIPFIYPIHPRARNNLEKHHLNVPDGIRTIEPLDYLDFLELQDEAEIVLTDSGGVQEESCILKTPCVTLRENTERPETLEVGANALAGSEPDKILASVNQMRSAPTDWENPFGDGEATRRILTKIGFI